MIDCQAVRDSYANHEISDVGLFRSKNNPADGLTKTKENTALLPQNI